jgi:hypothetical protein
MKDLDLLFEEWIRSMGVAWKATDKETDRAHDEAQDLRATGPDREQEQRGMELQ